MLSRPNGPLCPRCSSRWSRVLQVVTRWGKQYEKRGCGHCGGVWQVAIETPEANPVTSAETPAIMEAATFQESIVCRGCGSSNTKVSRTMPDDGSGKRVRYHKCKDCGRTFKSHGQSATG